MLAESHQISDLSRDDRDGVEQAARVLLEAFRGTTPAWPDMAAARQEVEYLLARVGRVDKRAILPPA